MRRPTLYRAPILRAKSEPKAAFEPPAPLSRPKRAAPIVCPSPPAQVSAEVLEAGRRIGVDLYEYISSFASPAAAGEIRLPAKVFEKWLQRFNDKCRHSGLDWLYNSG